MPKKQIYSSNAEKQRAYRERKKLLSNGKVTKVTNITKATDRVRDPSPIIRTRPRKVKSNELPLLLMSEVIADIKKRKIVGFNLDYEGDPRHYNDRPVREVFDTTLRLLKEKLDQSALASNLIKT